jgi:hypothetical protein
VAPPTNTSPGAVSRTPPDAEFGFQIAGLLADHRLIHVEGLGGSADGPVAGDGEDVADLAKIHLL